jgi:hypothetical protein
MVQQRRSRVPIYTNCEGGDVDLGGYDDGDGDVAVDDAYGTSPHAKGVPVVCQISLGGGLRPARSALSREEEDY